MSIETNGNGKKSASEPAEFTKEAFLEFAAQDPEISAHARELRQKLIRQRAQDEAIWAAYEEIDTRALPPFEPDTPRSRQECGMSVAHILSLAEGAAAFMYELGSNTGRKDELRMRALESVGRLGGQAASMARAIDRMWAVPKSKTPKAAP